MSAMVSDSTVTTTYGNETFNYSGLNYFTNVSGRALQVLVRYNFIWDSVVVAGTKSAWFNNGSSVYAFLEMPAGITWVNTTSEQVLTLPAGDSLVLNLYQHYSPFPGALTVRATYTVPSGDLAKSYVSITVLN